MTQSLAGTRGQAQTLQADNNVAELLRGAWFHVSKDNVEVLTDEINHEGNDDEYSWFSRSPDGGGHAGGCILLMYVVETPELKNVYGAALGDQLAKENGRLLPRWWLRVHKSEVAKLMIVDVVPQDAVAAHVAAFQQDPEYVAIRAAAVQLLNGNP